MAIKKIELEVGPDSSDMTISKKFSMSDLNLYLGQGEAKDFRFELNFLSPELRQGDFGRWFTNGTGVWDRTWYRAKITQFIGEPIVLENYEGHPRIFKTFFDFKNAQVNPRQGSNKDIYGYEVTILGSYKDNISLKTGPSPEGPWADLGTREYATPNQLQTLKWNNNTLGFDFNIAYYKFVGRKNSTVFEGPFWPVTLEFKNASVAPPGGTPDRRFNYTLELNASRPIDVVLNVRDVGTGKYFAAKREGYGNASHWDRLKWKDITVTSQEEAFGASSYYFSFHYPGSEAYFDTSQKMTGMYYVGPNLSIVNIESQVTPSNGTIYTPFTYTANVATSKPTCNIELEILPPGSKIWAGQGIQEFERDEGNLVWPNLSFKASPDVLGMGRYRFMMDNVVLAEFQGPEIDVAVRNESYKKAGTGTFDYSAEVRSTRPSVEMELIYTDDGIIWVRSGLTKTYASDKQEWITMVWKSQPWHNTIRVDERKK
ncbi:Uncharacterised protein [uncultured archaeon]|nr:Uncharacterised protein [uncultured archaeon]